MAWYLPTLASLFCGVACFSLLPAASLSSRQATQGLPQTLGQCVSGLGNSSLGKSLLRLASLQVVVEELQGRAIKLKISLSREDSCGLVMFAVAALSLLAGVLGASPTASCVALCGSVLAIPLVASSLRRKKTRELAQEMPQIFRTLASALGSGESLSQAIAYVGVHEQGRAAEEFGRAALQLRCGESSQDVLRSLSSRLDAPGVRLLTSALAISQRTGSSLDGLLQRSALMVERQEELERLLSVKTAQARLSVRIVCIMPALMVGLLSLFSQDFQRGLASFQGLACVVVALVMDGAALLVIRSLMKGAL